MSYFIRVYQEEAVTSTLDALASGERRILNVLPQGTGKSVTISELIRRHIQASRGRVILIVHRRKLVRQLARTMREAGLRVVVEQGETIELQEASDYDVAVCSVQTLQSRPEVLDGTAFDLVVIDETHRALAEGYLEILERLGVSESGKARLVGFSVGPESVVELRGGPFGRGWVGPIGQAYEMVHAASKLPPARLASYELLHTCEVESRGWTGTSFGWKPVKRFIRHPRTEAMSRIKAGGAVLDVTNDHSVFRLTGAEAMEAVRSDELQLQDTVLYDNGAAWTDLPEDPVDVPSVIAGTPLGRQTAVRVDLGGLSNERLRQLGCSPKQCWSFRHKNPAGSYLPLDLFMRVRDELPEPTLLYRPGRGAISCPPKLRLSEYAWVLGYWLGNGWVSHAGLVGFSAPHHKIPKLIAALAAMPFGWTPVVREPHENAGSAGSKEVQVSNAYFVRVIEHVLGGRPKAHTKHIPGPWILSWTESARRALLDGLVDSDGRAGVQPCNRRRNRVVTTSPELAHTLLSLLRSLGIMGSLSQTTPKKGGRRIVGRRTRYDVHWPACAQAGDNGRGTRRRFRPASWSYNEAPVKAVNPLAEAPDWVYDLEMDGHPSFVANGVLVHNTATDYRGDEQPLDELYTHVAIDLDLIWAMREYWVVPIKARRVAVRELVGRRVVDEALTSEDLARGCLHVIETELTKGEKVIPTVIMAPSVPAGEEIAAFIRQEASLDARMVSSHDPARAEADIEAFERGDYDVLVAYDLLVEGWDCPRVQAMLWCRNTRSPVTFAQGLARIDRPYFTDREAFERFNRSQSRQERKALIEASPKPVAYFYDLVDLSSRYNIVTLGEMVGLSREFDFEGEEILSVVDAVDELASAYPVLSTDRIGSVTELGLVVEDVELWNEAITPNEGVPENAQLVYTKYRDEWRLSFPAPEPGSEYDAVWVFRIRRDARGVFTAEMGQLELWREWYWSPSRGVYATKVYRGTLPPDTTRRFYKYEQGRRVELPRYFRVSGAPFTRLFTAHDLGEIFYLVEDYVYTHFDHRVWRLRHKDAPWRERPLTPGQARAIERLRKKGIAIPDSLNSGTASALQAAYEQGLLRPVRLSRKRAARRSRRL